MDRIIYDFLISGTVLSFWSSSKKFIFRYLSKGLSQNPFRSLTKKFNPFPVINSINPPHHLNTPNTFSAYIETIPCTIGCNRWWSQQSICFLPKVAISIVHKCPCIPVLYCHNFAKIPRVTESLQIIPLSRLRTRASWHHFY